MTFSRRSFLSAAAVATAFGGMARRAGAADAPYRSEVEAYGPLKPDPAGLFDLPEGFGYRIVSRFGDAMSDGLLTPGKIDGMGCFPLDDRRVVLVRNHELKWADGDLGPYGPGRALAGKVDKARVYDHTDTGLPLVGGTTTLVWDVKAGKLETHFLSLAGTSTNCAGGTTPWGSWLSCEETTETAGLEVMKDHGWVFEVPASAHALVEPRPLEAMGRFRHEAAAVDPRTGAIYLTEDEGDGRGLFYRFLPNAPGKLAEGGRLQALGFAGGGDSRNWDGEVFWRQGDRRPVVWLDLDGVDNPYNDLRYRGEAKGAAWFARGEGVFTGSDGVYFACTSGGPGKLGQIMRYRPSRFEGQPQEKDEPGQIELFVQPSDPQVLDMGDNIAVSPWGHLFVCEDKEDGINFLKAITPEGKVYTIGRSAAAGGGDVGFNSELAGVCFSPDGSTVFVNVYRPGMTVAITGPWGRFKS